jgi:hypothetical protein
MEIQSLQSPRVAEQDRQKERGHSLPGQTAFFWFKPGVDPAKLNQLPDQLESG